MSRAPSPPEMFALVFALLASAFPPSETADSEPCGARGEPGEKYGCTSLDGRCRGSASGAYWRVGNTTAYAHACAGAQVQHDGAVCVGEGAVYRANATRFGHVCRGVAILAHPNASQAACAGESWGEGPRANATGRTCPRAIPPFEPTTFIYDLLSLVSYSDFAAIPRPLLTNPLP